LTTIGALALIAVGAISLGVIFPGGIASMTNVFSQDGIIAVIHSRLSTVDVESISVQPFYQHIIMYFWPLMYFCLGVLVFLLSPVSINVTVNKPSPPTHLNRFLLTAFLIFLFAAAPLIFRNLLLHDSSAGRTVYAYSNFDIDPFSFAYQLFNFAVFSLLLSALWIEWSSYYISTAKNLAVRSGGALDLPFDAQFLNLLSNELLRLQLCLAVLCLGFVVYTAIFWKQIIQNHDQRFIIEAVLAHALWIVSAVLMGLPFWAIWHFWRINRIRAISELVQTPASDGANQQFKLNALREIRPVGSWNVAALIATIGSSLVAPVTQLILKLTHLG